MSESSTGSPWSRIDRIGFGAFAAVVLLSLAWLSHPWFDATPDAIPYIATARSLAAGSGYSYLGAPFQIRPPGFSLLIASLVAPDPEFRALNLLVGLFGAAGVLLLALFLRPRLGMPLAILAGLCVWLNPGYQRLCNQVMSDIPGMALILGCLLLERWARRSSAPWRHALLGAAIGATAYLRSIALLLVLASAASWLWQSRRQGGGAWRGAIAPVAALALSATLVVLPWSLRNRSLPEGPAVHTRIHSYAVAMWHVDSSDPASPRVSAAEILARVPRRAAQTLSALGSRLQVRESGDLPLQRPPDPGGLVLALALLLGTGVQLLRRRETAEIFAALSLGVFLVYFGFSWRLVLPLYLIGLGATLETLRDGIQQVASPRAASGATAAAVAGLLLLDLPPRRDWPAIAAEDERLRRLAADVEQLAAPDETVASPHAAYGVFLQRPVYNLRPLIRRDPHGAAVEATFDPYGIELVAAADGDARAAPLIVTLRERYGEPVRSGAALVWRVRPAPAAEDSRTK